MLLAVLQKDPEWINRAGAAVVCAEGAIAIAEHRMKGRFARIDRKQISANEFLQREIERAESRVFKTALVLAIGGEALHGFGDLIFKFGKTFLGGAV